MAGPESTNRTCAKPTFAYFGAVPSTRAIFDKLELFGGFIYIFWGHIEEPLYVGMSTNIAGRFAKHRQRGWWPLVSAVELYQLPRQPGEAEHAFRYRLHQFELSAIDYLRPTENIAGVSV